jgi:hypothetical protein
LVLVLALALVLDIVFARFPIVPIDLARDITAVVVIDISILIAVALIVATVEYGSWQF